MRVAKAGLQRVHLFFHREEAGERAARLVEQRPPGMDEAVLRQISDGQRRWFENRTRVGLVEPGHHPQKRRLARPVRSAEPRALAVGDLPGDVVEEDTVAERFR